MPKIRLFLQPQQARTDSSSPPYISISFHDTTFYTNYGDAFISFNIPTKFVSFTSIPQDYLWYMGILIVGDVYYEVKRVTWQVNIVSTAFSMSVRKLNGINSD